MCEQVTKRILFQQGAYRNSATSEYKQTDFYNDEALEACYVEAVFYDDDKPFIIITEWRHFHTGDESWNSDKVEKYERYIYDGNKKSLAIRYAIARFDAIYDGLAGKGE